MVHIYVSRILWSILLVCAGAQAVCADETAAVIRAIEKTSEARSAATDDCRARFPEEIDGFAKVAGTTGGLGRSRIVVTSSADRHPREGNPPVGGLRAAFDQARREGGGWITFSLTPGAVIELKTQLVAPPNITLDGGCKDVTIVAPPGEAILWINTENVVVQGIDWRKPGTSAADQQDCISVGNSFDRVYIAYNDFGECGDGQIDVTAMGPTEAKRRVTIAFNRFSNHDKSMIVGTLDCYLPAVTVPCGDVLARPKEWPTEIQATLFGNLFLNTRQRHPRISGRVYAHLVNNIVGFQDYGAFIGTGGRALFEDNLYFPVKGGTPNALAIWTTSAPGSMRMPQDHPGAVVIRHALSAAPSIMYADRQELVPEPPYSLADRLRFDRLSAVEAAACIAARAGRYGKGSWMKDCSK